MAVEKPGDAEEPRREGGKEAARDDDDATRRREAADLTAQQSMAASAVRMLDLTFAQIVVGFLGIVGLGATIYYSRQTARAAIAATQLAGSTAERQLRAYIGVAEQTAQHIVPGQKPEVVMKCKNFGQTPGYQVSIWTEISVMKPSITVFQYKIADENSRRTLNPGGIITVSTIKDDALTADQFEDIKADRLRLYCFGLISYDDAFKQTRTARFRFETKGERVLVTNHLAMSDEGNEAD